MKVKYFFLIFSISLFLFSSVTVLAAEKKEVIFNYDILTSSVYQESPNQWQIFNNKDEDLYSEDEALLLKSSGDVYLIYPIQFNYHDYDRLTISLYSNRPVVISLTPNMGTMRFNTFEIRETIDASEIYQEINFSLRQRFFKQNTENLGINFYSKYPTQIVIKEISLSKLTFPELIIQAIKDYWRVAPYESYTVNLFPTPLILGHSALVYFLPILLVLIWFALFNKRFRKIALIIIFLSWLLVDLRMSYEFLSYHLTDYQSFVKPKVSEKSLRNYNDFYQFSDWVNSNLENEKEINFYNSGSAHFPRILQYLIYPSLVHNEEAKAKIYISYNRTDITYSSSDQKLYKGEDSISEEGDIVAEYNNNSFIFVEK